MSKTHNTDHRAEYYTNRVKEHGRRYSEFHWPSVEMLLNLVHTYDVLAAYLTRKTSSYGITRSGFNVLMILSRSQSRACKQNEISQLMLVSRANITGLVDSLARLGLVERTSDPHDRRVNMVKILPKGEKLLEHLLPGYYKYIHDICSVATSREKSIFNDLLIRLRNRTRDIKS